MEFVEGVAGHRSNMLDSSATRIGLAAQMAPTAAFTGR